MTGAASGISEDTEESQSGSNILMRQRGADDNAARLAAVILI